MLSRYTGERYRDAAASDLVEFVSSGDLHCLSHLEALAFYEEFERVASDRDRAYLGATDRFYLLSVVLHRDDLNHDWLYDRCREVELQPDSHLDLWAREHYKSTIITYAGIIQEILHDPEITIGVFGHTKDVSSKFVSQIKNEFETNTDFRSLYPDVCWLKPDSEAPTWTESAFTVRRKGNPKEATVEAHGVVKGQPTSRHFRLRVYDDLVTLESVSTAEQVAKTTSAWELSDNLGSGEGRFWMIGTRYCSVGAMRVTMADWTQKPISEVKIGDEVVGWELRDGGRYLRRSRVVNLGMHQMQPVNRYTLDSGRTVTCTADHKWWRGPHGGGPEYAPLGLSPHVRKDRPIKGKKVNGRLVALRQLLVPIDADDSWRNARDAGWLAGFFDGEGTMKLNTGDNRASGCICITQTMANPGLIEETRRVLRAFCFSWTESWHSPSQSAASASKPALNQARWNDRCVFTIGGGWPERYRFLTQIAPARRERIVESLFAKLQTDQSKLVGVENAGKADVYWLETETGNYVIEGFCSSNSYGDTYGDILGRGIVKPRLYPATANGKIDGAPVFMTPEVWARKRRTQRSTLAAQMLQNPLSGKEQTFRPEWMRPWYVRPAAMNVYIMGDPSRGKTVKSDRTAMAIIGISSTGKKYLLGGVCRRMTLSERWDHLKSYHKRWSAMPGVGVVKVGYERYGQQSDDEYFQERMRIENYSFGIQELAWPNEGPGSKKARVERLQPDVEYGDFLFPGIVWANGAHCLWSADIDSGQMNFRPLQGEIEAIAAAKERGQPYLACESLTRKNEDGELYDLTRVLMEQMLYFPYATHDDLVDAASRIYDMEPVAALMNDQVPEIAATPD